MHLVDLVGPNPVGPTHQHKVGTAKLFGEQFLQGTGVIQAGVCQALGFQCRGIGHHRSLGQGLTVHHGDHPIHPDAAADFGPVERRQQGLRQGQTTGFHQNSIQLVGPLQQGLHGGQEIILNGAAETAIGQLHHPPSPFLLRTESAAAQQVAVDADLAKLIHQHGQPQSRVEQQVTQQAGLAGAEKAGDHRHRQAGRRGHRVVHLSRAPWQGPAASNCPPAQARIRAARPG